MAIVTAKNKRTGKLQDVPAHYIDNPNIFKGVFTKHPAEEPAAKPVQESADKPAEKPNGKPSDKN